MLNVGLRGMKTEVDEERMKTVLETRNMDIMGVVEHWRGGKERVKRAMMQRDPSEESEGLLGESFMWWERCRTKGKRGGVGLVVRKNVGRVVIREELCCESVIWAEITRGEEKVAVCVAYMAPEASVYEQERVDTMSKIAQGLEWAEGLKIIMLMDANGRIGKMGLEVLVGGKTWLEKRESVDTQVNKQGVDMLNLVQTYGIMLRNGLLGGSSGAATCRGKSVIDWIAVSWEMRAECQPVVVETAWEDGKRVDGDHKLVRMDIRWGCERSVEDVRVEEVEVKQEHIEGWNIKKGWEDGWKGIERESDRVMKRWCENWKGSPGLEQIVSWQKAYKWIVSRKLGRKRHKKWKKNALGKEIMEIVRKTREATVETLKSGEEGIERKSCRAEIQRQVRKKLFDVKRKAMEEIERGGAGGREDFIRALKRRNAAEGDDGKKTRVRMRKGEEWITGKEMNKEWVETFARVGRELNEKEGFDERFRVEVEEKTKKWAEAEGRGWKGVDEEIEEEISGEWRRTSLDGSVEREEVGAAVERVKNNKAAGVDEVVGEVLKYGGEWMVESIYQICRKIFDEEEVPTEWLRAIKVPIRKKGKGDKFEDYRGITLLSVIGKVYAMVLERRVRLFLEAKGKLGESQFGFRKGKSTIDAIFVMDERVKRVKGEVYIGFLDIAKAYPSVWRDGLWYKLRKMGIEGKMWRVLRKFYSRCEVGVRVNGELQDWYEETVGLREGCVMSPILFAAYIDELAETVRRGVKGVTVELFADDIALIAETREDLQKAFDLAHEYSKKWRFEFNIGVEKSAVLVVGKQDNPHRWTLGGRELPMTQEYKYLGVRVDGSRGIKLRREDTLKRTRASFWRAWGLGMGNAEMSAKAASKLWEIMVMPVLEYGGELERGKWEEAERLQRFAGRMVLGVGNSVADEVVLGELGWWTVAAKLEMKRLKYWWKLVTEKGKGQVGKTYEEGRTRVEEGKAGRKEWCWWTKKLLGELGMEEVWQTEDVGSKGEWIRRIKQMIEMKNQGEWRERILGKGKLRLYNKLKDKPGKEHYLTLWRKRVSRMVRLRGGVAALQVETGRRWKKRRADRICKECMMRKVEDEVHLLEECPAWLGERNKARESIRKVSEAVWWKVLSLGKEDRAVWMMKNGGSKEWTGVGQILEKWVRERESKEVG